MTRLSWLVVRNYRSLADVDVELGPINVLFGPNGAGKSTLLDTIWFFRDCAIRGVELASSTRSHGIGILFDAADEEQISVSLGTDDVQYQIQLGMSSGRMEAFAGESLRSNRDACVLIDRKMGADSATLYHSKVQQSSDLKLREPEKLSLGLYLDFNPSDSSASDLDRLLHFVRFYHSRSFFLHRLKTQGSESGHETRLWDRGDNAWSVLRNLHDRRSVDARYDTIMGFMAECFPSFDGLVLEQTGPNAVYANFLEKGRRREIRASGVSDGHLQMLLLLTALFSEDAGRSSVVLFDEPEISLHPWALAVLAKAIRLATDEWNRQVLVATHSPVLISQFEPDDTFAVTVEEGRTQVRRLTEIPGTGDLLEEYAAGSLYMAEMVAPQSKIPIEQTAE